MKKVFFTPKDPSELRKGMGYVLIEEEIVNRIGIRPIYRNSGYGGKVYVRDPNGREFTAYCDNPYGFGGRNKRKFQVYSHDETIQLIAQKKLTINAIIFFVKSWADKEAKIITPGKRTIDLQKNTANLPCYVYFIMNSDSNAIKIGISKDVNRRLASLQTSSPAELDLLCKLKFKDISAARNLEQSLHGTFEEIKIRGEWFQAKPKLLNYIQKHLS